MKNLISHTGNPLVNSTDGKECHMFILRKWLFVKLIVRGNTEYTFLKPFRKRKLTL